MPKYFDYKVAGYYLYFTSHCVIELKYKNLSRKITKKCI